MLPPPLQFIGSLWIFHNICIHMYSLHGLSRVLCVFIKSRGGTRRAREKLWYPGRSYKWGGPLSPLSFLFLPTSITASKESKVSPPERKVVVQRTMSRPDSPDVNEVRTVQSLLPWYFLFLNHSYVRIRFSTLSTSFSNT